MALDILALGNLTCNFCGPSLCGVDLTFDLNRCLNVVNVIRMVFVRLAPFHCVLTLLNSHC